MLTGLKHVSSIDPLDAPPEVGSLALLSSYRGPAFLTLHFWVCACQWLHAIFSHTAGEWLVQWTGRVSLCQTARILLKIVSSIAQVCQRVQCSAAAVNKPSVSRTLLWWNILFLLRTLCLGWRGKKKISWYLETSAALVYVSVDWYPSRRLHWQPAINYINHMKSKAPGRIHLIRSCLKGLLKFHTTHDPEDFVLCLTFMI